MSDRTPPLSGAGFWLNLALISGAWGSSFLFVKLIGQSLPPFAFAAARGAIGSVALLFWLAVGQPGKIALKRGCPNLSWRTLRPMIVLGTTNGWLGNTLTAVAVRHVDTAVAAIIQASVPLIVIVLAHFWSADEPFRPRQLGGVLVGLLGILLIAGPLAVFGARGSVIGIGAMLATALCLAAGTVYGRMAVAGSANPTILACGQQAFGAGVASVIAAITEPTALAAQPARVWLLLVIVGILCSALPTLLYLRLLARARAVPAALVAYLQPVWAAVLGCVLLGEAIGATALFGAGLVVAGIFLGTSSARSQRAVAAGCRRRGSPSASGSSLSNSIPSTVGTTDPISGVGRRCMIS